MCLTPRRAAVLDGVTSPRESIVGSYLSPGLAAVAIAEGVALPRAYVVGTDHTPLAGPAQQAAEP